MFDSILSYKLKSEQDSNRKKISFFRVSRMAVGYFSSVIRSCGLSFLFKSSVNLIKGAKAMLNNAIGDGSYNVGYVKYEIKRKHTNLLKPISKKLKCLFSKPKPKIFDYSQNTPTQLVRVVNVLRFPFFPEDLYELEDVITGEKLERPVKAVHHFGTTWIAVEGVV